MSKRYLIGTILLLMITFIFILSKPIQSFIQNDNEKQWLISNSNEIQSLESEDYKDLEFLKPLLKDKKYVFLGESSHGVSEYNLMKVRMVKYLHRELGFDVLAFESSMLDTSISYADKEIMGYSGRDFLRRSIFGIWDTQEVSSIFDYIIESQPHHPLHLTGVDIQPQNDELDRFLTKWMRESDPKLAEEFSQLEKDFRTKVLDMFNGIVVKEEETAYFRMGYEKVFDYIQNHEEQIFQDYHGYPDLKKLLLLGLQNRINFIEQLSINNAKGVRLGGFKVRDEMMAENIVSLANEIYPGKKIIIWGHNGHIRDNHSEVLSADSTGEGYIPWNVRSMFENLPEQIKEESYTIGFYAYEGSFADNYREIKKYNHGEEYNPSFIEYKLNQNGYPYSFIDIRHQKVNQYNKWISEPVLSVHQGEFLEKFIPKNTYDGLIFIRTVNPPMYY